MKKSLRLFFVLVGAVLFASFINPLNATHIVGGDISYKCLGSGDYEITLTVRRDCENGEEPFDSLAYVGIFDGYGNLLPFFGTGGMVQITGPVIDTLDSDLDAGCGFIGQGVCVEEAVYVGYVNLPWRATGYYFAYQRCCRNGTINNISEPLNTGATIYTRLTEKALEVCNDNPSFNAWPDLYICANQTLNFDHSASESDGDSLVYKLCSPKIGATFDDPQPVPPSGPPWTDVTWIPPFNEFNPMGGIPLTINPNNGFITANPNAIGQFLVGICVEEYRNGVLLSYTRRDFEFNVRVCTEGPMAQFSAPDLTCDGLTVDFLNESTDADSYVWNFNWPSTDIAFQSFEENPTFTYTEEGSYIVTLEAIRDIDGCSDTYFDTIGVYISDVMAAFSSEITSCNADSTNLQMTDESTDSKYPITAWEWTFTTTTGFSASSDEQNPIVKVPKDDNVSVTLIAFAESGCSDTLTQIVDADPLDLEVLASPAMICQGDTTAILIDPNCDVIYSIIPLTYVWMNDEDPDDCNIYIAPLEDISYTIFASNGICFDSVSLAVEIIEKSDISIVGDTLVCDGTINLGIIGDLPMNQFNWSFNEDFDPLIGTMADTLDVTFPDGVDTVTVYAQVKDGTGCSDVVSFQVINGTMDYTVAADMALCEGTDEEIIITNNDPDNPITIVWGDNPIIVTTTDTSVIVNSDDLNLMTFIVYTVSNDFGCTETDSIAITVEEKPTIGFTWDVNCEGFEFCFTNTSTGDNEYFWDFGDETTLADTSLLESPCYTYPGPGVYDVTLTIANGACEGESITLPVTVPVLLEMTVDPENIDACIDEEFTLTADVNVDDVTIEWVANGEIIGNGETITTSFPTSTVITVTATDSLGCSISQDIPVDIYMFDFSDDAPSINCVGDQVTVTLTNNSDGDNFTYDWSPDANIISGEGTNVVVISADNTTTISVHVVNTDNGCETDYSFEFNVSVIDATLYADPEEPYQCTEGEIGVLNPDGDWTFMWDNGSTDPVFTDTLMQETTYTVTITDENGCTAVESITVSVILPKCDDTDVFLPNAFSPNGDGVNDVLMIRSNFIKKSELNIFDRWGEMVFSSTDKSIGWDGTYKGSALAPDVYAFRLDVTCSNGELYQKIGNVTIVR